MKTRPLLIIEDEENDVFFLKRAITKSGIKNPVQVVSDGQQAMDYLKGAGPYADRSVYPTPIAIFLDLKLPCVPGLDILRWLRTASTLPFTPVIVMTSSTLASDVREAYAAGANSFIVKPPDPEKLVEVMRSFAGWWLNQNTYPHES